MKNASIPQELPKYIDPSLDLAAIKQSCKKLVKSRAKYSAGVAIIPVPFLDVAVDAGLLSQLLPEITSKFRLIDNIDDLSSLNSKDERLTDVKDRAMSFAAMVATRGMVKQTIQGFGGKILTKQVTKYIPFGGQIVAASLGYFIFTKVANDHIDECFELAKRIQSQSIRDV